MELGDLLLQLLVDVLRAADEADAAETEAARVQRIPCRLNDARVVRQAKILLNETTAVSKTATIFEEISRHVHC
jgi:uncharacterized protein YicC (UPF0701 family)